ncbi:MAG: glycosyltransferase [Planctomycetota bacterium]|jgi:glycosyltransferase involved in cell wall biosynthesis|nr:glycosyltransferase [Planctomycetota bacterium]
MFSLIVPAHNEAKTLLPTLQALANQTLDYEIVVACNGCDDDTPALARAFAAQNPRVRVVESEKAGMSWGKNFGAANSRGEILVFIDADTRLPPTALVEIARALAGKERVIGTMAGAPDRGGPVVRVCFAVANWFTRRQKVHAPGGVMVMHRAVWEQCRFDENLPQGTSSDLIMRARALGAEYVFIGRVKAVTSIRRFEKTGIVGQMLAWRKNHRDLRRHRRAAVAGREYENVR